MKDREIVKVGCIFMGLAVSVGLILVIVALITSLRGTQLTGSGGSGGGGSGGGICGAAQESADDYIGQGIGYSQDAALRCGPLDTKGPAGVKALDCSGYVSRAYHDAGSLPSSGWCLNTVGIATSSSYSRIASDLTSAKSALQAGDVILFGLGDPAGPPDHGGNSHAVIWGGRNGSLDIVFESGGRGGGPHRSEYNVFGGGRMLYGVYRGTACVNPTPTSGQVIVLDPGHKSEVGSGTANSATGIKELDVNWQVTLKAKAILEQKGVKVVLTKKTIDQYVTNKQRAETANTEKAALFFRVHANSDDYGGSFIEYPNVTGSYGSVRGPPQSIWKPSEDAARIIAQSVQKSTGLPSKGALSEKSVGGPTVIQNGGVLTGSLYSLVPTCTLEMIGMGASASNARWIADENNQQKMAQGIADGILEFLKSR